MGFSFDADLGNKSEYFAPKPGFLNNILQATLVFGLALVRVHDWSQLGSVPVVLIRKAVVPRSRIILTITTSSISASSTFMTHIIFLHDSLE